MINQINFWYLTKHTSNLRLQQKNWLFLTTQSCAQAKFKTVDINHPFGLREANVINILVSGELEEPKW